MNKPELGFPEVVLARRFHSRLGFGGVPLFPNTPEGQAERLAYYEARKLNHLPDSLLDYHDVIRGPETPGERRSRQGRASGRRRSRFSSTGLSQPGHRCRYGLPNWLFSLLAFSVILDIIRAPIVTITS